MPTVSGFISIADLVDGQTGATIVLSNEAHTFIADALGVVDSSELANYSSTVAVYSGSTAFTYEDASSPGSNGRWTVNGSVDVAGQSYRSLDLGNNTDLELRIADSDGTLTLHDQGTGTGGFVDEAGPDSATLTVPIAVQINGTDIVYNRAISVTKALGGSAPFIRMESTAQQLFYAYAAADPKSGQSNIVFTANSFNFSGTPTGTWRYSVDGAAFADVGSSTGHTVAGANTDVSTLTVTPAGMDTLLGSGTYITYRFQRTSQGASGASADQISVAKIEDADAGGSAVIAVIAGSTILKNNPTYDAADTTTYVDLEAQAFVGGDRINDAGFNTGIDRGTPTYVWSKNGTAIPASGSGSLQISQPSGYGRTNYRIRVGGNDVTDGGSEEFSCAVTYT